MNIKQTITQQKLVDYAALALAFALLVYTTTRAITMAMTHDECSSYFNFVALRSNWDILFNLDCFNNANNHILNTFCARFGTWLFGMKPLALRWGSLMMHGVYLFYAWQLSKKLLVKSNPWLALSLFVALNFNPYLLDFFSLERGYSWSTACTMACLFYFHEKNIWKCCLFILIGTFGNLTMLNTFILLALSANVLWYVEDFSVREIVKKNIPFALTAVFLGTFLFRIIRKLKEQGEFLYGADKISKTYESLWQNCFNYPYLNKSGMTIIGLVFFFLIVGAPIIALIKHKEEKNYNTLIMCLLPLFSLIIMDIQFHILGSKYLEDRRAIILFPSLIISFAAWLNLSKYKINYFWAIVLMLFSFSHWAKTANLLSVKEWAYDSNNKKVIAYLEQKAIEKNDSLLVSSHWFFQGSLNFHARANPNSRIAMPLWAPEMPTDNRYDYYYIGNYTPFDSTFYTLDTVFDNNHLYKKREITIK